MNHPNMFTKLIEMIRSDSLSLKERLFVLLTILSEIAVFIAFIGDLLMGENIYDLLKKMIDDYDPNFEVLYDSTFVPSESCGCKPSELAVEYRLDSIRNQYRNSSVSDMVEFQFQEIRGAMSKVDSKEAFF